MTVSPAHVDKSVLVIIVAPRGCIRAMVHRRAMNIETAVDAMDPER
ncbi:MAG TPA: hypothetical protein VD995_14140 [Azospirillum sp.]|nr:hypothetical protein [Azospirillum sp.]